MHRGQTTPQRERDVGGRGHALLDVTEQVMLADGYAAVASRRVAAAAGVTPALVHYYFKTIDDLFLAVIRRRGAQYAKRQERALSSPRPIHALWELSTDRAGTGLLMEFIALANHRKVIAVHIAEQVAESRLDPARSPTRPRRFHRRGWR